MERAVADSQHPLRDRGGGLAFIEVKRTMQITASRLKPLLSEVIQQYLISEQNAGGSTFPWRRSLNPAQDRLLLVTSSESPESVTKHLANCLSRIGHGTNSNQLETIPQNQHEIRAFGDFHAMTLEAWKQLMGAEPSLDNVVRLYSLFRIVTLDVNPDEADEQHARTTLATGVIAEIQDSAKAWSLLVSAMGARRLFARSLMPVIARVEQFPFAPATVRTSRCLNLKYSALKGTRRHWTPSRHGRRQIHRY